MAAYKCKECDFAFPAQEGNACPLCARQLIYDQAATSDPDWRARLPVNEEEQVTAHRLYMFLSLGVPLEDAEHLAGRRDVDYHDLARLISKGCDPDLALRIVA